MQSQTSGAPAPLISPSPPIAPGVPRPSPHSGSRRRWILGALLVIVAVGGYFLWRRQASLNKSSVSEVIQVRTHTVSGGTLERTVRLTGTTGAENFVSLIAPQLHGSRSGRGRTRSGGSSASSGPSASVQSNSGRSSAVSGPSATAISDSGGSSLGRATNASSSSRVSRSVSGGGKSSGGGSGAKMADLGSTASGLPPSSGGGGGGGGGSDFTLVLQHLVKPGTVVKKGDQIAEFDRQYMLLRLDDYRDSVHQQELDMNVLKANLDVSRKARQQKVDAARAAVEKAKLDLKTTPVRSEIDTIRLRLALEEAEASLKEVLSQTVDADISEVAAIRIEELDFDRADLELKRATANADRMISKAPIEGLTVMQNIFRGTEMGQIQQGDQLYPGQFFMQIVDLRSMVVNATVNQADVELLKIGAKARVRFDAYPDLELPAHVYSIGAVTKPGGMRASYVKEVPVRLKMDKLDPRVIPDLSVGVDVVIESDQQAAAIAPLESVFRDGESTQPYVFVQSPDGWIRRDVELGLANAIRVAVRSGLKPGEVIAQNRPPVMKK